VLLQGQGRWDTIWEPLVEFARSHGLASVKIDLSLPWLHEGYHATWHSLKMPEKAHQLSIRLPLFVHRAADGTQAPIGRLEILAPGGDKNVYERIGEFSEKLMDLGPQLDLIVAELEQSSTAELPAAAGSGVGIPQAAADEHGPRRPASLPSRRPAAAQATVSGPADSKASASVGAASA
jgi:UDP-GlcNAc:undecaprenyl-phosphate GlcNAc-1-phosphate transferase